MFYSFFLLLVAFLLVVILKLASISIRERVVLRREELSPYECGFEHHNVSRVPLSLRYFFLTLLFLLFDLEVVFLLFSPLFFTFSTVFFVIVVVFFVLFLYLTLFYEWADGTLEWIIYLHKTFVIRFKLKTNPSAIAILCSVLLLPFLDVCLCFLF